ncbi:MAG: hypothetical protein VR70_04525 [Rhodospirillaceae bacterium BRH_c57]|nr:MAG: hypothetical protein VR70_04525 [Rhodospirillaceae bacterium BRH_c57]
MAKHRRTILLRDFFVVFLPLLMVGGAGGGYVVMAQIEASHHEQEMQARSAVTIVAGHVRRSLRGFVDDALRIDSQALQNDHAGSLQRLTTMAWGHAIIVIPPVPHPPKVPKPGSLAVPGSAPTQSILPITRIKEPFQFRLNHPSLPLGAFPFEVRLGGLLGHAKSILPADQMLKVIIEPLDEVQSGKDESLPNGVESQEIIDLAATLAPFQMPHPHVQMRLMAPVGPAVLRFTGNRLHLPVAAALLLLLSLAWSMLAARAMAERRMLLADIADRTRRFQDFAEVGSDWYWETGPNHHITSIAGSFQNSLGIAEDAIVGQHYQDLLARHLPRDQRKDPQVWTMFAAVAEQQQPFRRLTIPWCHPDGTQRMIVASGRPIFGSDGEFQGYRCTSNDITELSEAQEALRVARDDALRADRAKSAFVAGVSHDLRQPLQALRLYTALLIEEPLSAEALSLAQKVKLTAEGAGELLTHLLDLSRLENGEILPQTCSIPLKPFLDRLVDEMAGRAEIKGLSIGIICADRWATSDPALLERVLRNLVSNAINYTRQGGVLVTVRPRGDRHLVQVWDTGTGIPEDELDNIFDDYRRGSLAEGEGTGLGLAVVRRAVKLLGQHIKVRSRVGSGTVFSLLLPAAIPAHSVVAAPTVFDPECCTDGTVLVIDDDAEIAHALGRILEKNGLHAVSLTSLGEVEAWLAEKPRLSVVVTDFHLGDGVKGSDVITLLRDHFSRPIPAVAITADATAAAEKFAGTDVICLAKPVSGRQVVDTVRRLWGRTRSECV